MQHTVEYGTEHNLREHNLYYEITYNIICNTLQYNIECNVQYIVLHNLYNTLSYNA